MPVAISNQPSLILIGGGTVAWREDGSSVHGAVGVSDCASFATGDGKGDAGAGFAGLSGFVATVTDCGVGGGVGATTGGVGWESGSDLAGESGWRTSSAIAISTLPAADLGAGSGLDIA